MSETLLVEIVTEEIPAGYIEPALEAMATLMGQRMFQARIAYKAMTTLGTPRRLALVVGGVAKRQASTTDEILGPPKGVAFDAEGRPTKAAKGFAKSQGVSLDRLSTKATAKGEYVCVQKVERGLVSWKLLQRIIPEVITLIPFPKSMRWADLNLTFARPVHAVVALLGDRVIPFRLESIKSGRRSLGHRFIHPDSVRISDPSEYVAVLRKASVVVDIEERRGMIRRQIARAASRLGGQIISDDALLETVTQLVEYPAVSVGTFDEAFLNIPSEVLITAMREHQKYFAVVSSDHQLLPCFVAVNNMPANDMAVIASGHEKVLRARLEDARFFFETDTRASPDEMVYSLKGVLFQAKLGSVFDKVCRIQKLAEYLAQGTSTDLKDTIMRAAWLCKSDLTSQMVNEFPKLQGVMGRIYAARAGEPEAVSRAIEEHYLPAYAGGPLPQTVAGALVSVADKLDTICACFGIGLVPTGTTDPYALRRQAVGIINILLARAVSVSLEGLIGKSLDLLEDRITENRLRTAQKVLTFFQHRVEHLLAEEGFSKDVIAAVVSTSIDDVPAVLKRTEALQGLKGKPDFEPLAVAFKRVVNIIKKATQLHEVPPHGHGTGVDTDLFERPCEQALYGAFQKVKHEISEDVKKGAFDRALRTVSTLRGPVDGFFDGVMVLTDDQRLKQNRLALLAEIAELFSLFADFSKIST